MSAVYGLALALGSWLIINVVNPDILVLKPPGVGLPGGKYVYDPGPANLACANSTGNGTTQAPCKCADGTNVTFTAPATTGPYVVSTSIAPCADNLAANLSPVTITFNEPVTLSTNAIGFAGTYAASPSDTVSWTIGAPTGGNTITFSYPSDLAAGSYTLTVYASNVIDAKGNPMASNYNEIFTVGRTRNCALDTCPCTPPLPAVIDCYAACSISDSAQASTINLQPPGYHCLSTGLKVGTNLDSLVSTDKITIKAGQKLYVDMNDSKDSSGVPLARYELNWNNAPLGNLFGSFTCCPSSETGFGCFGWKNLCIASENCSDPAVTNPYLITSNTYSTAGTYKIWYNIENTNCQDSQNNTNPSYITVDVQ